MPRMRTELSDGRIRIRAYEPCIELAVFEAARESVREVGPWMRTWREGATYEATARHVAESMHAWRTGAWYDFAITRADSVMFLRRVGLNQISASKTANVGYWVQTGQARQGIATAAVQLIAQFGFEDLGLLRLELLIAVENPASWVCFVIYHVLSTRRPYTELGVDYFDKLDSVRVERHHVRWPSSWATG
jgi:ribosomal-protein-serine acetyltransferase